MSLGGNYRNRINGERKKMSKGIIVLGNVPTRCSGCFCYEPTSYNGDTGVCSFNCRLVSNGNIPKRPIWCPIKEINEEEVGGSHG